MLNPFPEVLFLAVLAPTILRIAAGGVLLSLALKHWGTRETVREHLPPFLKFLRRIYPETVILVELVLGALLFLGVFTQIAALLGLLWAAKAILLHRSYPALFPLGGAAHVLLAAVLLTLFLTGAGAFAFDLPL